MSFQLFLTMKAKSMLLLLFQNLLCCHRRIDDHSSEMSNRHNNLAFEQPCNFIHKITIPNSCNIIPSLAGVIASFHFPHIRSVHVHKNIYKTLNKPIYIKSNCVCDCQTEDDKYSIWFRCENGSSCPYPLKM